MVRRCREKSTGKEFAAERLSAAEDTRMPYLLENEVLGLTHAKAYKIPRVVKYVRMDQCNNTGDLFLLLE